VLKVYGDKKFSNLAPEKPRKTQKNPEKPRKTQKNPEKCSGNRLIIVEFIAFLRHTSSIRGYGHLTLPTNRKGIS
jgi:hypothetical protein